MIKKKHRRRCFGIVMCENNAFSGNNEHFFNEKAVHMNRNFIYYMELHRNNIGMFAIELASH